MTTMDETRFHFLSLDSDTDLSSAVLEVSTDEVTWVTADPVTDAPGGADLPAPPAGYTRHWWRVLIGPDEPLQLTGEATTVHGRLSAGPEELRPSWVIHIDDDTAECWPITVPESVAAEWAGMSSTVREHAGALAVMTLRTLTAHQVGGCPVTYKPRRGPCLTRRPGSASSPSGAPFYPVLDSGSWLNIGCGHCGACVPRGAVRLPAGHGGVLEVHDAGVLLDPSTWEVVDGIYLARTDGEPWAFTPCELTVTLYPNPRPGDLGALAAGALAVEYGRARVGSACRIPDRARRIARQGVDVELSTVADLYPQGLTGVTEADLFVRAVNPHRLVTAPTVWSPDLAAR